jgi:hypothetical protein
MLQVEFQIDLIGKIIYSQYHNGIERHCVILNAWVMITLYLELYHIQLYLSL